ncbi:M56 family metallopeptidase [Sediminibacterium ginsengisoli]|uniref:Signal transducer regulating beta-lactamase production, contains metallopeptidase domain n=1 Tax=Sediminibacterium ginsengisoli TaxID=413434 RepID=A0A1T4JXB7_9BACT|nr:M56 family metallopeptidase [Sediminibacterium ginsengisoli]SJZ34747.1 Signal transducer regulating beta-lactamase production, contains metallopeptidase domain [Sediminibacterium ginsengisoli]
MTVYFFNLALAISFSFYFLLLRKTTWYTFNRFFLLLYPVVLLLPFLFPLSLPGSGSITGVFYKTITPAKQALLKNLPSPQQSLPLRVIFWVYLLVSALLLLRLLLQWISYLVFRNSAEWIADKDGISIYRLSKGTEAFSIGRSVYIPGGLQDIPAAVLRHEMAHAGQWHTLDILFAEILIIINWINPFAWFTRNAIRTNLEFIADREVINSGYNKKEYQYLLLGALQGKSFAFANSLHSIPLKQRISMMNKPYNNNRHRMWLLLPVTALVFLFQQLPAASPPFNYRVILHRDDRMDAERKKFFTAHTDLLLIYWKKKTTIVELYFTGERIESFDLSKKNDVLLLQNKYGDLPAPVTR